MASSMPPANGLVHLASRHSVTETLSRLEAGLQKRGINIFARIDHAGAAAAVGLKMPPTEVLIFGSPKAGTPVMLAAPTTAIDLPLKALVWQDPKGKVWLTYNVPDYLRQRHGFPAGLLPNLAGAVSILEEAVAG